MDNIEYSLDKTAFSVSSLYEESDETDFWISKSPARRLEAMELMRRINYGYDPITERLQRFFEVAELK
jgi:hypothetical protein